MQEQQSALPSAHGPEPLCKNCDTLPALSGYPTLLCADCRQALIRYPIPRWIWLFAGGVLLVMIIGLVQMPKYFSASIHLARGERAYEARKYITAQSELERVVAQFPNDLATNGKLLVAALHNMDYVTAARANAVVVGKPIEDKELFEQMQTAIKVAEWDLPSDTTLVSKFNTVAATSAALEDFYQQADTVAGGDGPFAGLLIANKLYDMHEYQQSGAMLERVLQRRPDWRAALTLLSAVKRSQGDFDGAIKICDDLLRHNREDVVVLALKARIELKRKHDADAGRYAAEAMRLKSDDLFAMEAMAMVDHYAGKADESRRLLALVQNVERNSGDSTISQRLRKVMDGTEPYR